MTSPEPWAAEGRGARTVQNVYAFGGFAYGAINADVHVHGDGHPVYLLEEHRPPAGIPGPAWVNQPSRLLNARSAVVPFTGREAELRALEDWRDDDGDDPVLSVRWLFGPGGRGKSRLADHFAAASTARGWKTVVARHGSSVSWEAQGSHDARPGDRTGLLVLVDYADRWPLHDLTWLFANSLFPNSLRRGVPVRVLLLARTVEPWPAVQSMLGDRAVASAWELGAVPDTPGARERVFAAARSRFAELYRLPEAASTALPLPHDHPDSGLFLTLHMAALAGVDALAHGRRPPKDPAGLTAYLLHREREWWERLSEGGAGGAGSTTEALAGAAFVAALTGATDWDHGAEALAKARLADDPAAARSLLADHARCYPPLDPATVLEPLYPDRLAEDFVALCLPGHDVAGYRADPWAAAVPAALLTGEQVPAYALRAMTFLAAAAERWPHVRTTVFHPLVLADPRLALPTHPTALAPDSPSHALGEQSTADFITGQLEIMDSQSMEGIRPERAWDFAYYAVHLHERRLADAPDERARAKLHLSLATRLARIGRYQEAVAFCTQAVARYRDRDPADLSATVELTDALTELARDLAGVGRSAEAVEAAAEAVGTWRAHAVPPLTDGLVAQTLATYGDLLRETGQRDEAVRVTEEAVALYRSHVHGDFADVKPGRWISTVRFASALSSLGVMLRDTGGQRPALEACEEAVGIFRRLELSVLAQHRDAYARALAHLSGALLHAGRDAEAVDPAREAAEIYRRLAANSPEAHEAPLAGALLTLATCLSDPQEALAAAEEAAEMFQRLAPARPAEFMPPLETARDLVDQLLWKAEEERGARTTLPPVTPETRPHSRDADAVLLVESGPPPTDPFERRVARLVDLWDSDGRHDGWLVTGTAFFILNCWFMDSERRDDPPGQRRSSLLGSPAVQDYVTACRTAVEAAHGWAAMLRERRRCPGCGHTWRLENLQACAGCSRYTCYECQGIDHRGEFCEIVG
ncbi:tetratricopeptide repeat protein [Streptomyces sp. NPDC016562]|uniref:tetratricopeptide repeat protein n=1 Tax=Streptomyces sp. NPDC016562 TaxID=3364966 RepID=UPI0036FEC234